MRSLTTYRKPFTMPYTTICSYIHQPLHIHINRTAKITFYLIFFFDDRSDTRNFVLSKIFYASIFIDLSLLQNLNGGRLPDSINIRKSNDSSFISRNIYTRTTGKKLPLFLFMLGILTNYANDSLSTNNLTLFTNRLY
jgi:hypothetical protein